MHIETKMQMSRRLQAPGTGNVHALTLERPSREPSRTVFGLHVALLKKERLGCFINNWHSETCGEVIM